MEPMARLRAKCNTASRLLIIITLLPHAIRAAASKTCYGPDGIAKDNLSACYPDQTASHCCSGADLCLSNGLCLDMGADNDLTAQGCTDQNWAGCSQYCEVGSGDYTHLAYCSTPAGADSAKYCCDNNSHNCCTQPASLFDVPLFSTAFLAPAFAAEQIPKTATVTVTGSGTFVPATATANSEAGQQGGTSNSASGPAGGLSSSQIQTIAIAVPLGVVGCATIAWALWLHSRKKSQAANINTGAAAAVPRKHDSAGGGQGIASEQHKVELDAVRATRPNTMFPSPFVIGGQGWTDMKNDIIVSPQSEQLQQFQQFQQFQQLQQLQQSQYRSHPQQQQQQQQQPHEMPSPGDYLAGPQELSSVGGTPRLEFTWT